jgi:hypothetical protein
MTMRTIAVLLAALAFGAAGCGKSDKPDNSNVQSPNDQPIGVPQQFNAGAQPARLDAPSAQVVGHKPKPLPNVEVKP